MPRNQEIISLPKNNGWVLLTNTNVTAITFQVQKGEVQIRAGDTQPPTDEEHGYIYKRFDGERQVELSSLAFSGATRVWARANGDDAKVLVDHA